MKTDLNEDFLGRIVAQLDNGVIPWHKPWVVNSSGILSRSTGKPYSLRNRLLLDYAGEYATIHQINKLGGRVKKGEHGSVVYFAKTVDKKDENGEVVDSFRVLRAWTVFRTEQCENVPNKYEALWKCGGLPSDDDSIRSMVEKYMEANGIKAVWGGAQAFFSPSDKMVQVPGHESFSSRELYWKTLFHELVHSTGEALGRKFGNTFGSSDYAHEELVADIGACLLLGKVGLTPTEAETETVAYCQNWSKKIKSLKGDITKILNEAQTACDFIFTNNTKE